VETNEVGESQELASRYQRVLGDYSRGLPGPLCFITGGMHGNEPAGIEAVVAVLAHLREHQVPMRGRVVAVTGNLRALSRKQRYIESDLNRIWLDEVMKRLATQPPEADAHEESELRSLIEVFSRYAEDPNLGIIFLDLHTTSAGGAPFQCMGDTLQNRKIAYRIPVPLILGLEEVIHGSLLEFVGERGHVAIAIEGGQHDDPVTSEHHEAAVWQALVAAEMIDESDVPNYERHRSRLEGASRGVPHVVEVRHRHGLEPGDGFKMRPGFCNFHPVRKGELLATDNTGEIRSPMDCLLLLPCYQGQGNDGFFLGLEVKPFWLKLSSFLRGRRAGRFLLLLPGVRRGDPSRNTLIVNRRIARYWPTEIFHLFGYRRCEEALDHLIFTRRREFPATADPGGHRGSRFLGLFLVLFFASLAFSCSTPTEPPSAKPPVILIVLDALSAKHLSHLGYEHETTPNIDALAGDGVTFTTSFAPAPYTLASIPSILTGRHPDTHGLSQPGSELPASEVTLAELLGEAGYRTFAAIGNLQGSSLHALDQGFSVYEELFREEGPDGGTVSHIPSSTEFLPVLKKWNSEESHAPPFYYLHLLEPHIPYAPPADIRKRYIDPSYTGRYKDGVTMEVMKKAAERNIWNVEAVHHGPVRSLYDANIEWVDANVGEIFDYLREVGLYDRSLILLTSDHGESFWQHGRWGHSTQVYDEMLQVPLVIKLPKGTGPEGLRIDTLASVMDIVPTVCELLNLPAPPHRLDGISLVPAFINPKAFENAQADRQLIARTNHKVPVMALRGSTRKTIVTRPAKEGEVLKVESYAIATDPGEEKDLGSSEGTAADVEALLEWAANAKLNGPATDRELTDDEQKHLEDLGYMGEDEDEGEDEREDEE